MHTALNIKLTLRWAYSHGALSTVILECVALMEVGYFRLHLIYYIYWKTIELYNLHVRKGLRKKQLKHPDLFYQVRKEFDRKDEVA